MPAFSQISSSGTTPGIGLETPGLGAEGQDLDLAVVTNGTRRLSSVTDLPDQFRMLLAKNIDMSPPLECPIRVR